MKNTNMYVVLMCAITGTMLVLAVLVTSGTSLKGHL